MQNASPRTRARRLAAISAAAVLAIFGVASVVRGADGLATVRDALKQEAVVGTPDMTPAAIAAKAKAAGVNGLTLPTCSVAGRSVADGATARCFAEYMRIDALIATGGRTYAQMPRFASPDGKGTNVEAQAQKLPNGVAMPNPARNVWITETALSNALNTSYMAEQVSLFGIAVGAMFLLVGFAFAGVALGGVKLARRSQARRREQAISVA